jgi:hypothetical protein
MKERICWAVAETLRCQISRLWNPAERVKMDRIWSISQRKRRLQARVLVQRTAPHSGLGWLYRGARIDGNFNLLYSLPHKVAFFQIFK